MIVATNCVGMLAIQLAVVRHVVGRRPRDPLVGMETGKRGRMGVMRLATTTRRRRLQFAVGMILLTIAAALIWTGRPDWHAIAERLRGPTVVGPDADDKDRVAESTSADEFSQREAIRAIQATSPYPIRQQPGIWPPELPEIPRPLPPPGATSVTGYIFAENDIHNPEPANLKIDYLRIYATAAGKTVLVNNDDYGTAAGQKPVASGDWTPRSDMTDPTIEIPGTVAEAWAPTYFITTPSAHPNYATQIWNAKPGRVPAGATKVWVEARLLVTGSGLAHIGFDWYGPKGYIANGGYSGFQIFASPSWQTVTFGK
jgi:hypothetical protein